jgi:hypothetical protein
LFLTVAFKALQRFLTGLFLTLLFAAFCLPDRSLTLQLDHEQAVLFLGLSAAMLFFLALALALHLLAVFLGLACALLPGALVSFLPLAHDFWPGV